MLLLGRACRGEDSGACLTLSRLLRNGYPLLGLPRDELASARAYKQGMLWAGTTPSLAARAVAKSYPGVCATTAEAEKLPGLA
jgi:hypothetical protein